MAYLRDYKPERCRCGKPAKVELLGRQNQSYGHFCKACGGKRLREEQSFEDHCAASKS